MERLRARPTVLELGLTQTSGGLVLRMQHGTTVRLTTPPSEMEVQVEQ
jgi:hypothetical protein